MSIDRIVEKIKAILLEKASRPMVKNGSVLICCPFHLEKTPSCGVTLFHPKYPPGTFYCFGCGAKGNWNALAEKHGFKFRVNQKELNAHMKTHINSDVDKLLRIEENSTETFLQKNVRIESYTRWPVGMEWRGVDYEFLQSIDAYMLLSPDFGFDDEIRFEQMIFLPVKVNNVLVGGISAALDRKKYINTEGDWVKTRGLFPFDVSKKLMMKKKWTRKFVVLVEGPRDAARLVIAGIPALAILGSKNWTEKKAELLATLCADDVELVLMFDADAAGKSAYKTVKKTIKDMFKFVKIKLPEYSIENGEKTKCDVFNLSDKKFNKLVKLLVNRYTS